MSGAIFFHSSSLIFHLLPGIHSPSEIIVTYYTITPFGIGSKAIALGLFGWLLLHRLLRAQLYGGAIWHPTLCDLALLVICIVLAFALLLIGG